MEDPKTVYDLDWTRKAPCKDCPFLKSSPYHEGIAERLLDYGFGSYASGIEAGQFCHTCHKTDNREAVDGPKNYKGEKPQHCYGAIMMMLKSYDQIPIQESLMAAASKGLLKPGLLAMARRAKKDGRFFTWREMLSFYAEERRKRED
jgi:hypothetical protein